jgi:hypothetical protein
MRIIGRRPCHVALGGCCAAALAVAVGCSDSPTAAARQLAICDSPVTVRIDTSVSPIISWTPACAATGVSVDFVGDGASVLTWDISAADSSGILPNVAYGEARSDAKTLMTPVALRTGFPYQVTVLGGTTTAPLIVGTADFRPVQQVDSAFQIHVAMPDTVYGRATEISFVYPHAKTATLYVDEGSAADTSITSTPYSHGIQRCATEWDVDFPPLPAGRHNFRIAVLDSAGHVGSMTGTFVISIPRRTYHLTFLGSGADSSDALAINSRGTVAGWIATANASPQAVLWSGGHAVEVPTADSYTTSRAVDVNSNGVALLMFTTAGSPPCRQGGLWANGTVSSVFPGRCDITELTAINDSNVVVGAYVYAYPDGRTANAQWFNDARDINNKGQIVGRIDDVYSGQAASWTLNVNLPYLVPHLYACNAPFYSVHDDKRYDRINDRGQAIGIVDGLTQWVAAADSSLLATPTSTPTNLVDLSLPLDHAHATGIDPDGLVVALNKGTIYLWFNGVTSTVLIDDPSWRIDAISDIGDGQRIVGRATNTVTGAHGAVLLEPVS